MRQNGVPKKLHLVSRDNLRRLLVLLIIDDLLTFHVLVAVLVDRRSEENVIVDAHANDEDDEAAQLNPAKDFPLQNETDHPDDQCANRVKNTVLREKVFK